MTDLPILGQGTREECRAYGFPNGTQNFNSKEELDSIYKSLECPICQEFPEYGPVYSCLSNRHMICQNCRNLSNICPACSSPIQEQSSKPIEMCIFNFLFPCKNKFHGCPHILRGKDIREHVTNCTYGLIPCIMSQCEASVAFKDLFKHLTSVHSSKINGIENSSKYIIEWWIDGDITKVAKWPPFYFTCFGNVFLYICVSTIHGIWGWMWMLADEEESKRFQVQAKIESLNKVVQVQWKGPVHSIRKSMKAIISSGQVFVINSKEIPNPFLFRKSLKGNKWFWKTDVEIFEVVPPLPTSIPYFATSDDYNSVVTKVIEENLPSSIKKMNPDDLDILPDVMTEKLDYEDENTQNTTKTEALIEDQKPEKSDSFTPDKVVNDESDSLKIEDVSQSNLDLDSNKVPENNDQDEGTFLYPIAEESDEKANTETEDEDFNLISDQAINIESQIFFLAENSEQDIKRRDSEVVISLKRSKSKVRFEKAEFIEIDADPSIVLSTIAQGNQEEEKNYEIVPSGEEDINPEDLDNFVLFGGGEKMDEDFED